MECEVGIVEIRGECYLPTRLLWRGGGGEGLGSLGVLGVKLNILSPFLLPGLHGPTTFYPYKNISLFFFILGEI